MRCVKVYNTIRYFGYTMNAGWLIDKRHEHCPPARHMGNGSSQTCNFTKESTLRWEEYQKFPNTPSHIFEHNRVGLLEC
jgi:hypothetical protein